MRESLFRFKKFSCSHGSGSMKIGVDAVLVGAWADVSGCKIILDVGTGCGVIALICAQRTEGEQCSITGIDVDASSVAEATKNFACSPWRERLKASLEDFNDNQLRDIDLIISNPPYFQAGVANPDSPRLHARHEDELSPGVILQKGSEMISEEGRIALVVPADRFEELCNIAQKSGLALRRAEWVKGHPAAPVKRVLMEFCKRGNASTDVMDISEIPVLTLELSPGVPTEDHRRLCHDLYLKY